mgnify:CR=1 FL=1
MRSMTGFGSASVEQGPWRWMAEVRSVNHRFLELRFSMPREFARWEAELRALVQSHAARGKVDVSVNVSGRAEKVLRVQVNVPLARRYVQAWRDLQKAVALPGDIDLRLLLERSELFTVSEQPRSAEQDRELLHKVVAQALSHWDRERRREGRALERDLRARLASLEEIRRSIHARVETLVPALMERLRRRVRALLENRELDEQRLAQEVVLIAERSDVTEELVRLKTHLAAARATLREAGSVGKRLEFLFQELHREFNTIASKSADAEVTRLTIAARTEIEKLKEQVQNVE